MQEEIFGPVVCVTPFDTEEEVINRANNVKKKNFSIGHIASTIIYAYFVLGQVWSMLFNMGEKWRSLVTNSPKHGCRNRMD